MNTGKIIARLCLACIGIVPLAGFGQKVVVTPSGSKYHLESCRSIGTSSQTKAVDVTEAKAAKLPACSVCKPPVKAVSGGVQCSGSNMDGARCKRKTTDKGGKCWQHV